MRWLGLARLRSLICSLIHSTHIGIKRPKVGWRGGVAWRLGPAATFPRLSPAGRFTAVTMVRSLRFQPPPLRTVHAVLPHTAHRRRSPLAFGLARQSRKGLGSTTIPDK